MLCRIDINRVIDCINNSEKSKLHRNEGGDHENERVKVRQLIGLPYSFLRVLVCETPHFLQNFLSVRLCTYRKL